MDGTLATKFEPGGGGGGSVLVRVDGAREREHAELFALTDVAGALLQGFVDLRRADAARPFEVESPDVSDDVGEAFFAAGEVAAFLLDGLTAREGRKSDKAEKNRCGEAFAKYSYSSPM